MTCSVTYQQAQFDRESCQPIQRNNEGYSRRKPCQTEPRPEVSRCPATRVLPDIRHHAQSNQPAVFSKEINVLKLFYFKLSEGQ